jgi:hypothetical protein
MSKYCGSGCRIPGLDPQKTASLSKTLLLILNHLADPQGDPKSQIQVPEMALLLSSVMADPAWLCLDGYPRYITHAAALAAAYKRHGALPASFFNSLTKWGPSEAMFYSNFGWLIHLGNLFAMWN